MTTIDALKKAEEMGYDLVEVAPMSQPPVCKIMDYGKYKYELNKKAHTAKQHQKGTQLKEIKVTVMFRGREMAYQQMGRAMLDKVLTLVGTGAQIEQPPRQEGRFLSMVLAPQKK